MNLNRKKCGALAGALLITALGLHTLAHARAQESRIERRLAAMGTSLVLQLEAETRPAGLAQSELAVRAIEVVEQRLSTWREESELSSVNAAPAGESVRLSDELARDLQRAAALHERSDGKFDPALGPLVEAWDLRGEGRVPAPEQLEQARLASGWQHFQLEDKSLTRKHAQARLEEGAFGKGIALDAARSAVDLEQLELFAVELGGQWIVQTRAGTAPFPVGIASPSERMKTVLELRVAAGSVATSGNSERGIIVEGVRHGHILDPASGRPAQDFGSVTVLAPEAATADALATALFVMGPDSALDWASKQSDIQVVVLENLRTGLRVRATAGLRSLLTPLQPGLELEFVDPSPSSPRTDSRD
jgi:thiamine biosynthesis lipoprotein